LVEAVSYFVVWFAINSGSVSWAKRARIDTAPQVSSNRYVASPGLSAGSNLQKEKCGKSASPRFWLWKKVFATCVF
jgi:hypothetical protein